MIGEPSVNLTNLNDSPFSYQLLVCFNRSNCFRLDTQEFKPSRDQRQSLNKWARYILGEDYIRETAKNFPKSKECVSHSRKNPPSSVPS